MISALLKRLKRPKQTRPKLYYDGAHDGQVLPKDSVADSLIPLEPRFMFDAAGVATGAEVAAETVAQEQAEASLDKAPVQPVPPAVVESTEKLLEALSLVDAPDNDTNEIIFIDTGVENYEALIQNIDSNAELVFIDANSDGLEQIANVLAERENIDAIHIVAHGDAGLLQLGNSTLTEASMRGEHADELETIKAALDEEADILIYGCNFAEGELGKSAAESLAEATGADIAASDDLTGAVDLGGDAELEVQLGTIETETILSQENLDETSTLLAAPVATDTDADLTPVVQTETDPPGDTVENLFSSLFSDADALDEMQGIAVVGNVANAGTEGVWEYSTNGGTSWANVDSGGTLTNGNALLLDSTDLLRFVPVNTSYAGTPGDLQVKLWSETAAVNSVSSDDIDVQASTTAGQNANATALNPDASDGTGDKRTLIRFALPSAAAGSFTIDTVEIEIDIFDTGNQVNIYAADDAMWNESNALWASADDADSGTLLGTLSAFANGTQQITLNSAGENLVRDWINGNSPNTGFAFVNTGTDGVDFDSSEGATPPELNITFTQSSFTAGTGRDITADIGVLGNSIFSEETIDLSTVIAATGAEIVAQNDTATTDEDTPISVGAGLGVLANDSDLNSPTSITTGLRLNFDASNETNNDGVWEDVVGGSYDDLFYDVSHVSYTDVSATTSTSITRAYTLDGAGSSLAYNNDNDGTDDGFGDGSSGLAENADATFEMWLRFDASMIGNANEYFLFETGDTGGGIALTYDSSIDSLVFHYDDDSVTSRYTMTAAMPAELDLTSDFVQIAFTLDVSTEQVAIYVNGNALTTSTNVTAGTAILGDWSNGDAAAVGGSAEQVVASAAGAQEFVGDIAIFNYHESTELSAADIQTNFYAVAGLTVTHVDGGPGGFTAVGGGAYTLTSGATVTLNADGSYDYDPNGQFEQLTAGQSTTDTFSYTVSDGTNSETANVVITINGVDDAIDVNVTGNTVLFTEDAGQVGGLFTASIDTIETADTISEVVLTMANIEAGDMLVIGGITIDLNLNGAANAGVADANGFIYTVSSAGASAVVTITNTGTPDDGTVNTMLNSAAFNNTSNNEPSTTARTVTLTSVTDSGSGTTADGEVATINVAVADDLIDINVTGNTVLFTEDAGTVGGIFTANIDTIESTDTISQVVLTLANVEAGDTLVFGAITVDLNTNGAANAGVADANGFIYTVSSAGSSPIVTITNTGTPDDGTVNAMLNSTSFDNASNDNPTTTARTITLTSVTDSGSGTTADGEVATVNVAAVTDAPVVLAPGGNLSAPDTNPINIHGTGFTVTDVDEEGAGATLTLDVGEGVINVLAGTTGVSIDSGNGSGTVVISGTIAEIDDLLTNGGGGGSISYTAPGVPSPTTTFTVTVNDEGNTGNDPGLSGTPTSEEGSNSVIIALIEINDAPTLTATDLDPTFTEDGPAVDLFDTVSVGTVEIGQTILELELTVTNLENGVDEILTIDGSAITLTDATNVVTGSGYIVSVSVTGSTATLTIDTTLGGGGESTANIETLIDTLTYQNDNQNPTDASTRDVTITNIQDSGGVSNGGVDATNPNITSTVTVNETLDAPDISDLDSDSLGYVVGSGVQFLDVGTMATVTDADSADFDTGVLTISTPSAATNENLGIQDSGTPGVGIEVGAGTISFNGTQIATFAGGTAGTDLVVTLDADANPTSVSALLQAITYENTGTATGASSVTVQLTDGDGATSSLATVTVNLVNVLTANPDSAVTNEDTPINVAASGVISNDVLPQMNTTFVLNYNAENEGLGANDGTFDDSVSGGSAATDIALDASVTVENVVSTTYPGITQTLSLTGAGGGNLSSVAGGGSVAGNADTTFDFWIKLDDLTDQDTIFENNDSLLGVAFVTHDADADGAGGFDDLSFVVNSFGTTGIVTADLSSVLGGLANVTTDFIHVVGTIDAGTGIELFVNGASQGTAAWAVTNWDDNFENSGLGTTVGSNAAQAVIGGTAASWTNFEGDIASFSVYQSDFDDVAVDQNFASQGAITVTDVTNTVEAPTGVFTGTSDKGGLIVVNADGSYSYDPNGVFESLAVGDTDTDTFTYTITDASGAIDTATVTITINGVNDAPVLTSSSVNDTLTENTDTTSGNLFTGTSIDPIETGDDVTSAQLTLGGGVENTDTLTISGTAITNLGSDSSGSIAGGHSYIYTQASGVVTITFSASTDAITAQNLLNSITYGIDPADDSPSTIARTLTLNTITDNGGGTDTSTNINEIATINVNDDNADTVFDTNSGVEDAGDVTGDVLANDESGQVVQTYDIAGGGSGIAANTLTNIPGVGDITVNSDGTYTFSPAANYNGSVPQITYNTDTGGTNTLDITIVSDNDAPTDIGLSNTSVTENIVGAIIGNLSVVDVDVGDSHTFTTNDPRFEVVKGQLKLTAGTSLDFETEGPTISIDITAEDAGGLQYTETFVITVNDIANENAPLISDSTVSIPENTINATNVFNVNDAGTGNDLDADGDVITYSIIGGNGTGGGAFAIDPNTGQITVNDASQLDFESTTSFPLVIQANAGGDLDTATITINLSNVNETLTAIGVVGNTVAENSAPGTVAGTLSSTDVDAGDTHTYSLVSGAGDTNNGLFTIVGNEIRVNAGLDFEALGSPLSVRVQTTDAGGLTHEEVISIILTNVNEAPADIALSNDSVAENEVGAIIGNVSVVDVDAGDTHTITTSDPRFEVVGGQLKLTAGTSLDFETEGRTISIDITAVDAGGLVYTETVVINVLNVNELATQVSLNNSNVQENSSGAVIGSLSVFDQDSGDTHFFTIDDPRFEVVGGQLKLLADQSLDFEADGPTMDISITTTDAGGLSRVDIFTITIGNLDENNNQGNSSEFPSNQDVIPDQLFDADNTESSPPVDDGIDLTGNTVEGAGPGVFEGAVLEAVAQASSDSQFINDEFGSREGTRFGTFDVEGIKGFSVSFALTETNSGPSTPQDDSLFPLRVGVESELESEINLEETDQLVIRSLLRERMLYVEVNYIVVSNPDIKTSSYTVTLANGDPLPSWLRLDDKGGLISGEPPVDIQDVQLKVEVQLSDGSSVVRYVSVDTFTGEISAMLTTNSDNIAGTEPFSGQMSSAMNEFEKSADDLLAALKQ
ncbi:MAG: DUF4347 domain-containing protein [Gammaproteobacteria bacterium]|nr:DUF4347 domain-containing protein [Gammaproteobacteria bacterium]